MNWRDVDRKIYDEFFDWVRDNQRKRMEEGLSKYKSEELGFQGDPLEHALEEILDALFYIYYAMRQRNSLLFGKVDKNQTGDIKGFLDFVDTEVDEKQVAFQRLSEAYEEWKSSIK